jgi:hypothetical protein
MAEAELFHADRQKDRRTNRQTDTTKLILAFRSFAKALKNLRYVYRISLFTGDTPYYNVKIKSTHWRSHNIL